MSFDPSGEPRQEDEGGAGLPAFFADPAGVIQRRWPWMVLVALLGLLVTAAVAAVWTPRYRSQATVLITSQQIPEDFVRSTVREDSIANINAMVGKVLSQENLSRLLDQFDLYSADQAHATRSALIGRIRSDVEVAPTQGFGRRDASLIYGLSFEADEPAMAADVANALAGLFIEASIARRNEQARRTTEFLRRELERDERELRDQSGKVSVFRREHRGELPGELATNLHKLEMLSERRQAMLNQIAETENRIVTLAPIGSTPTGELLAEMRRQLAREIAANTDEHPNVIALRRRVREAERLAAGETSGNPELRAILAASRREIEHLKEQIVKAEVDIADLNARVDRTPSVGEELEALEQKEEVLREDYLDTLRKVEEAELAESLESAQQGAQVSLLDSAQPPGGPTTPRWMILVGGVAASLGLALLLALALEILDPVVVGIAQLERIAERPVLGSIPRVGV